MVMAGAKDVFNAGFDYLLIPNSPVGAPAVVVEDDDLFSTDSVDIVVLVVLVPEVLIAVVVGAVLIELEAVVGSVTRTATP